MSRSVIVKVVRQRVPQPPAPAREPELELWTLKQLMVALQVSDFTIDEWRRDGLPTFTRGKVVRFVPADVLNWVRSHYADAPTPLRRAS